MIKFIMIKSNDGITIFKKKMESGKVYLKLRCTVEINGVSKNRVVSTGLLYNKENLDFLKKEAKPFFYEKLGIQLHVPVTLNEFYLDAMRYVNANANEETAIERLSKLQRYVLPFLGDTDLKKLEAGAVEEWQLGLKDQGVSVDLVRRSKRLLKRIFKRAVILGYRKDNPCDNTSDLREYKDDVHEIYSKKEVAMMIAYAEPEWLQLFILTFVSLWLRSNEIIVLKWSDINWVNSTLIVQRAYRRKEMKKPKTGIRAVEIPATLYRLFVKHRDLKSEWVFPTPKGSHYKDARTINDHFFKPLLERLKIPYRGMYELKHTGISIVFNDPTIADEAIREQSGHKDKGTFLKYYAQFLKDDETIKKIDKALNFNT